MKKLLLPFILLICLVMGLASCCGTPSSLMYKYHSVPSATNNQHWRVFPVYLDKDLTKVEKSTIEQVIAEWNYVLNGYMKIQVMSSNVDHNSIDSLVDTAKQIFETNDGIMLLSVQHDNELLPMQVDDSTLAFVNGLGDRGYILVVLNDRLGTKSLHKILLHEFGHLMGAGHVMTESLMYPAYGHLQKDCVDKITASQVATYRHLDLNHLNYCSTPSFP